MPAPIDTDIVVHDPGGAVVPIAVDLAHGQRAIPGGE
jgi:hypothetical protein